MLYCHKQFRDVSQKLKLWSWLRARLGGFSYTVSSLFTNPASCYKVIDFCGKLEGKHLFERVSMSWYYYLFLGFSVFGDVVGVSLLSPQFFWGLFGLTLQHLYLFCLIFHTSSANILYWYIFSHIKKIMIRLPFKSNLIVYFSFVVLALINGLWWIIIRKWLELQTTIDVLRISKSLGSEFKFYTFNLDAVINLGHSIKSKVKDNLVKV